MKILISNDDGVYAPGIMVLSQALEKIAGIHVVAPDRNRSGASNSLTLSNPIRMKKIENGFISVEGTPTDCVHIALTGMLDESVDMVVAGINAGANLGDDVLYSGTVAAATEGRFLGLPAMAVSLVGDKLKHYDTAAIITAKLVKRIHQATLPPQTILNVNVPDLPIDQIEGIDVTRLGTRHCAEPTIKEMDPRGQPIYWVGPPGAQEDAGPGSDFYAIENNRVSVTPLKVDLTNYETLAQVSEWIDGLTEAITHV